MIVALRYVEKDGGYWEVQTEDSIEQHISLRQFPNHEALTQLAARAIQEPGTWINAENEKPDERDQ